MLFEDNHCLAVLKAARVLVAPDETGDPSLLDQVREYLRTKYHKPGRVFVGLVHRLDRPVSGIVLFARTSKAAARLSAQFRQREVTKRYRAIVSGRVHPAAGRLEDWLLKDPARNLVQCVSPSTPGAQLGVLTYRRVQSHGPASLLEIELETGRAHQIRVQLASRGWPIWGDGKYGSPHPWRGAIALHAAELTFEHPTRHVPVHVVAPDPAAWQALLR